MLESKNNFLVVLLGSSDSRSIDLADLTSLSPVPMATGAHQGQPGRTLSLDPQVRLRVEKLEEVQIYVFTECLFYFDSNLKHKLNCQNTTNGEY